MSELSAPAPPQHALNQLPHVLDPDREPDQLRAARLPAREHLRLRTILALEPLLTMSAAPLHTSLRAQTNRILAAVWLAALVGLVFFLGHVPWIMLALGLLSGLAQGLLQRRALADGAAGLLAAQSALDVRAALVATTAGRAQIKILWGSLAVYLAALLLQRVDLTPLRLVPLLFSAVLAQWFVREAMTVGACAELERAGAGS